jgi:Glutathione synthase/Ribosomal protein S6 modification enzyme (glutaminyl transferase)
MILIFSYIGDLSTDLVVEWLNYYGCQVIRLNSSDLYNESLKIDLENRILVFNDRRLPLAEVEVVWFRKFGLKKDFELFTDSSVRYSVGDHLHQEHKALFETICYLLKDKLWLNHPEMSSLNKCSILLDAVDVGLKVSPTYIVNNCVDVLRLVDKGEYITKSLYDPFFIPHYKGLFSMYTKKISRESLEEGGIPPVFSASLLQKQIEKEYEIRVFYINRKIYSMAIFSQNDPQTEVDFRNYNWFKPNRYVPYKLPSEINKKIVRLMKKIGLSSGSLDFIKSKDGEYYFLEVNPVGQFGMVDFPCNYGLHQKVALELIKMTSYEYE